MAGKSLSPKVQTHENIGSTQAQKVPLVPSGFLGGVRDWAPRPPAVSQALAALLSSPNIFYLNANFDFSLGSQQKFSAVE